MAVVVIVAGWILVSQGLVSLGLVSQGLASLGTCAPPAAMRPDRPPAPSDKPARGRTKVSDVERLSVQVLRRWPHERAAFTQGLEWQGNTLWESTGLYGKSSIQSFLLARKGAKAGRVAEAGTSAKGAESPTRRVAPTNQAEQQETLRPSGVRVDLARAMFGEGIAIAHGRLFNITWKEGVSQVWRTPDLKPLKTHRYEGEGWGLCFDGTSLWMSDGSDELVTRNPEDFVITGRVRVTLGGLPVHQLNELECVDGHIYANVWMRDEIVRIDKSSGRVDAVVDASQLLDRQAKQEADVLNGIAYHPERKSFWITGKLWPTLFEVRFVPTGAGNANAGQPQSGNPNSGKTARSRREFRDKASSQGGQA